LEQQKYGRIKTDEKLREKYGENFRKVIMFNFHSSLTNDDCENWVESIKIG